MNQLNRDAQSQAIQFVGDMDQVEVSYSEEGHSGSGWYVWNEEYPNFGALYLGDDLSVSIKDGEIINQPEGSGSE